MSYIWEKAPWPAKKGDEIRADFFEDIRKLMFLVHNPKAGNYESTKGQTDYDAAGQIAGYDPGTAANIAIAYGESISWKGHTWILAYPDYTTGDVDGNKNYGLTYSTLFSSSAAWEAHKPPENINPSENVWVTSNTYWRLKPDRNLYHDWDKHAPTYYAKEDKVSGSTDTYLYLINAKEDLPEQIDSKITNDGGSENNYDLSSGGTNYIPFGETEEEFITRFLDEKKEFKKEYLTQIENLGTKYTPTWNGVNSNGDSCNYYSLNEPEFDGDFPNGNPYDPEIDTVSNPDQQFLFDPKICAAYQNSITALIELKSSSIYLAVDDDYQNNKVEYDQWVLLNATPIFDTTSPYDSYSGADNPSAAPSLVKRYVGEEWHIYECIYDSDSYTPNGLWVDADWQLADVVWNESKYEGHRAYAPINDIWWGCNESGLECLLKTIGQFDWWLDTQYPWVPQTVKYRQYNEMEPGDSNKNQHLEATGPNVWRDNYNQDEYDTAFPKPIGTWRRTFRHSFGRVDGRETVDYILDADPSDAIDTHALTKTLMLPGTYEHPLSKTNWKNLEPLTTHWWGDNDAPNYEIDATFGVPTHPMPWPGRWDSSDPSSGPVKYELWVGHNWDGVTVRPSHLPYFDSSGENYDNYSTEPDDDGRPDFEYEFLKIEYDKTGHGILTAPQIALVEAHLSMNDRHDPSQIVNDIGEYEIYADMLNDMRNILLKCNLRFYEGIDIEQKYHAEYGLASVGWLDTLEEVVTAVSTLLTNSIPGNVEDWDDGDGSGDIYGEPYLGTHIAIAQRPTDNKFSNLIYGAEEYSEGFLVARAVKIPTDVIKDTLTVERIWVLSTLSRATSQGYQRSTCTVEDSFDYSFELDAKMWNSINSFLPLEAQGGDWYTVIPTEPYTYGSYFDEPLAWDNWSDWGIVNMDFTGYFLASHDWDLLPSSVFDTPNIRGLKQTEENPSV